MFLDLSMRAYFDASFSAGTSGVTSIGGYVGRAEEWAEVEREWKEGLSLWGLDEFHLAPLLSGNTAIGRVDAELCALYFAKIIGRSKLHGIGAALRQEDWAKTETDRDRFPTIYHRCLDMLLGVLSEHMRLEFPKDAVAIVMDVDALEPPA
jgi:hypothetical protein